MQFQWSGPNLAKRFNLALLFTRGWSSDLTIAHPDGRVLKSNGGAIRLNTGSNVKFTVTQPSDVYGKDHNRVALNTSTAGTNTFAYHYAPNQLLSEGAYAANSDVHAWRLVRSVLTDGWDIYNDYSGGRWLGYDSNIDRLFVATESDPRRVTWSITPDPLYRYTVDFTPE
jgi:hypothetical protein